MNHTIPFATNGVEYIAEVVWAKLGGVDTKEYFVKINGDNNCFVNFIQRNSIVTVAETSEGMQPEMIAALQDALLKDVKFMQ